MITARDVSKKFGNVLALSELSFEIKPGEFVFLTGPSGSGKTTLLKLVLKEIVADKGQLLIGEQDIKKIPNKKLPDYRRQIGVVFQDFKLLSDRSVFENVSLPLEVRGVKDIEINSAVKKALELVGLGSRVDLFPAQLSGGELQRVAIARAIVSRPKLLLADEPTGNLDPKTSVAIMNILKQIHEELKTTIVMATHNADIVNHAGLRVIMLVDGKLAKDTNKGKYE